VELRSYRSEDAAAVARVFTDSVRSIGTADYSPEQLAAWAPEPPDLEHWRTRLGKLICFVAEIDSELVGFVTFAANGHLDHLYVHSRFQRMGVASALMRRVEQEALSRAVRRIFTEASITARPFFERIGFHTVRPQPVEHNGLLFINFRMEKVIPGFRGHTVE
jgi:putative acetyltransferase